MNFELLSVQLKLRLSMRSYLGCFLAISSDSPAKGLLYRFVKSVSKRRQHVSHYVDIARTLLVGAFSQDTVIPGGDEMFVFLEEALEDVGINRDR